jgi:hypothetical protein
VVARDQRGAGLAHQHDAVWHTSTSCRAGMTRPARRTRRAASGEPHHAGVDGAVAPQVEHARRDRDGAAPRQQQGPPHAERSERERERHDPRPDAGAWRRHASRWCARHRRHVGVGGAEHRRDGQTRGDDAGRLPRTRERAASSRRPP